jgi:hypothetical protein|mmetsp:Transcript_21485/g.28795  ORF Transcript_21485/g.28795 Transcript_21485/m.28795 type:complete len:116 (+) Transcript_21485:1987-2334(+)
MTDLVLIFFVRNFRFIRMMREVKDIDFTFQTCVKLTSPILAKFFFLYLVYYEYAQFAMIFYSPMSKADFEAAGAGNLYYLMNFNDFPSALVVLFQQMIVNNWYVVVGFYVNKTEH